jgi:lipopolysaccharide/colanic/teichoic acid biosynthesis glycosyltransferase
MMMHDESAIGPSSWSLPVPSGLAYDPFRLAIKRAIDLTGAIVGLTLFAPLMLAIALLIRMDSQGPVLFRQLRRGYRGRPFWVLKYRTMTTDAEQRLRELEKHNESAGGVLFKLKNDPRVTPIGRFLRRTSLDELPQLINVLLGEMSLVGPRPLQIRDSEKLQAENPAAYSCRLEVVPGVTGPWQIGGRSELDHVKMVELDIDYAKNWSLRKDLLILLKTPLVVLLRRGAY